MAYWTSSKTLPYKIMYEEIEQVKIDNSKLSKEVSSLLTKVSELTKLVTELTNILLSYNPKVAEQIQEALGDINDKTDDKRTESWSYTSR